MHRVAAARALPVPHESRKTDVMRASRQKTRAHDTRPAGRTPSLPAQRALPVACATVSTFCRPPLVVGVVP